MRAGRPSHPARRLLLAGALFTSFLIAGCVSQQSARAAFDSQTQSWSGRLGLTIASQPPQQFHAGFSLTGNAQAGELSFTSPLGSTLALLQWHPGEALLRQGEQVQSFASVDELAAAVTGTPIPVRALFAWLHGTAETVQGWQVDLDQLPDGRLSARRLAPAPEAELRIILDRP